MQNAPAELTSTLRVGLVEPLFFSDFLKSTHGIVDVLKYSDGLSFLPEFAVRHDLRHGNLKVIECDLPPFPSPSRWPPIVKSGSPRRCRA